MKEQLTSLLDVRAVGAGVEGPAGVQVARPARVASHVHGPAQGQQELQEVRLDAGRRLHVPQDLEEKHTCVQKRILQNF